MDIDLDTLLGRNSSDIEAAIAYLKELPVQPGGLLVAMTGCSGIGKNTLINRLRESHLPAGFSVSWTTRPMRPGEEHGVNYHFTDVPTFEREIKAGSFIEYATYAGNLYGTHMDTVNGLLGNGDLVLMDLETKGAALLQERKQKLRAPLLDIFLMPPGTTVEARVAELRRRLVERNTDSPEVIEKRMDEAPGEMERAPLFSHVVVNDNRDRAFLELVLIIEYRRRIIP